MLNIDYLILLICVRLNFEIQIWYFGMIRCYNYCCPPFTHKKKEKFKFWWGPNLFEICFKENARKSWIVMLCCSCLLSRALIISLRQAYEQIIWKHVSFVMEQFLCKKGQCWIWWNSAILDLRLNIHRFQYHSLKIPSFDNFPDPPFKSVHLRNYKEKVEKLQDFHFLIAHTLSFLLLLLW